MDNKVKTRPYTDIRQYDGKSFASHWRSLGWWVLRPPFFGRHRGLLSVSVPSQHAADSFQDQKSISSTTPIHFLSTGSLWILSLMMMMIVNFSGDMW